MCLNGSPKLLLSHVIVLFFDLLYFLDIMRFSTVPDASYLMLLNVCVFFYFWNANLRLIGVSGK